MNNEKRFISPLNCTRFAWLHRSFARSPDKSARYAGYASSAESGHTVCDLSKCKTFALYCEC